jgi:hypothetical protein
MHGKKNAYRIQLEKSEGKRLIGRPRRRRVDNIKMDFREIRSSDMDRINLVQHRNHGVLL